MATVLVAECETALSDALRLAFENAGHTVLTAANGREAVQLAETIWPDVLICDINMPVRQGLAMIKEFRERNLCRKIIAMSGSIGKYKFEFLPVAKLMGADVTFAKPFNLLQMVATVESLLS